jgi:hypothetical protein
LLVLKGMAGVGAAAEPIREIPRNAVRGFAGEINLSTI